MSRVFVAQETALGRQVVVKLLSSDIAAGLSAERFAREVRLAASLQHPNIVPVLATGVADGDPWYTMPYVRGESLRARIKESGRIPERKAVSILRDIARALQYAHTEGVIHRDIKPENVLLSGDVAVVTDFGIAKAISLAQTSDGAALHEPTLTRAGSTVGTPAYMAPEQVAGDTMDNRVDIYAWGLIAYELLTGTHPFAGKANVTHLLAAQMTEKPAPLTEKVPELSTWLSDLVMRCLEKSPGNRPSSAAELLDIIDEQRESAERKSMQLPRQRRRRNPVLLVVAGIIVLGVAAYFLISRREISPASSAIKSVAVLPFAHEKADSTEDYLSEGLAEELMTALGKVPGLRVASRTSSFALARRSDLDVREIAKRLGVSSIVEGTVRRGGGRLRVSAQLTNATDGLTMWSDSYDREDKDVFAMQSDIAGSIAAALRPDLGTKAQLASTKSSGAGTTNADAYDLYLRGMYLVERRGEGVSRGADYFRQAIQKDPNFARAYAALADALELFPYFSRVPAPQVERDALRAAEKSLSIDPSLAEPRVAMALAYWHAWRWDDADREFRNAIAADSTSAVARTQYGRYLLSVARAEDAERELRIARRLDPLAATSSVWLSKALAYEGREQASIDESKRSRELDPELLNNRTVLVFDIVRLHRFDEALSIMGTRVPLTPFDGMMAYNLERAGAKDRAAAIRHSLASQPDATYFIHTARMWGYLGAGDNDKALTEMEAAVAAHEITPSMIPFEDWIYDPLRQNPRFAALITRMGLDGRGFTSPSGGRTAR